MIEQWIPIQISRIHDYAIEELKGWISMVRELSESVGAIELSKIEKMFDEYISSSRSSVASGQNSLIPFEIYLSERLGDRDFFADMEIKQIQISFEKLLKAHHLFDLMDRQNEFRDIFLEHFNLLSEAILSVQFTNLEQSVFRYVLRFVGFLIIKDYATSLVPSIGSVDMQSIVQLFLQRLPRGVAKVIDDTEVTTKVLRDVKNKLSWSLFSIKLRLGPLYIHFNQVIQLCLDVFYKYCELLKADFSLRALQICRDSNPELLVPLLLKFIDEYFSGLLGIPTDASDLFDICKKTLSED